jgi:hypothetical protein
MKSTNNAQTTEAVNKSAIAPTWQFKNHVVAIFTILPLFRHINSVI